MKIFASNNFEQICPYMYGSVPILGADVATDALFYNLSKFSNFDEYHFFLPDNELEKLFKADLPYLQKYKNDKRIKFINVSEIPECFNKNDYTVFFTPGLHIYRNIQIRNTFSKKNIPVCGITHTLSYYYDFEKTYLLNLINNNEDFDAIICTSRAGKKTLLKLLKLKIKIHFNELRTSMLNLKAPVIPLGISTQDFNLYNRDFSRNKLQFSPDNIYILCFGRFSDKNKADLVPLLLAFKIILKTQKKVFLILAGNNLLNYTYNKFIEHLVSELGISDKIIFKYNAAGITGNEKKMLFASSDIFVSLIDSVQETFGLTVLEAMSSGLPVVISDWSGYKDFIEHGKTGFLVPTYWTKCDSSANKISILEQFDENLFLLSKSVCVDIKKVIDYLSLLIKNKNLRLDIGNRAQKYVMQNYDWSKVIPKYESLWDKLYLKANNKRQEKKKKLNFLPQYYNCFNHCSSYNLNKSSSVKITDFGIEMLERMDFPVTTNKFNTILLNLVLDILVCLTKNTLKIKTIIDSVRNKNYTEEMILFHIMWMMKNYYIEYRSK